MKEVPTITIEDVFDDPHAVRFIFQRYAGIDELIEQYHYGDLQVEPLPYYQLIRHLQAQVSDYHA